MNLRLNRDQRRLLHDLARVDDLMEEASACELEARTCSADRAPLFAIPGEARA